jgi:hypothetical protein
MFALLGEPPKAIVLSPPPPRKLGLLWINHLRVASSQTKISFRLAESLRIGERN